MIDWWFAWHALEPLRYKIWNPPCHFEISLSERDRAKVLDPARPLRSSSRGSPTRHREHAAAPAPRRSPSSS